MADDEISETHIFMISVAAKLAGMHAQTLRTYDRLGLVSPVRTQGGGRRYSSRDVELLRHVQHLSQEEGINLAGIKRIIELTNKVDALEKQVAELSRQLAARNTASPRTSAALVLWEPRTGKRARTSS